MKLEKKKLIRSVAFFYKDVFYNTPFTNYLLHLVNFLL